MSQTTYSITLTLSGEHEFLDEAKNYWDDMYDDVVQELIEDTTS